MTVITISSDYLVGVRGNIAENKKPTPDKRERAKLTTAWGPEGGPGYRRLFQKAQTRIGFFEMESGLLLAPVIWCTACVLLACCSLIKYKKKDVLSYEKNILDCLIPPW